MILIMLLEVVGWAIVAGSLAVILYELIKD